MYNVIPKIILGWRLQGDEALLLQLWMLVDGSGTALVPLPGQSSRNSKIQNGACCGKEPVCLFGEN